MDENLEVTGAAATSCLKRRLQNVVRNLFRPYPPLFNDSKYRILRETTHHEAQCAILFVPLYSAARVEMFTHYRVAQKSMLRECSPVLMGMFTVSDSAALIASHSFTPDLISNNICKFTN
jgi:hypothetical protein